MSVKKKSSNFLENHLVKRSLEINVITYDNLLAVIANTIFFFLNVYIGTNLKRASQHF